MNEYNHHEARLRCMASGSEIMQWPSLSKGDREAIAWGVAEIERLRAINAELLAATQSLLRWADTSQAEKTEGKAEHDDIVKGRVRSAIAKTTAKPPRKGGVA